MEPTRVFNTLRHKDRPEKKKKKRTRGRQWDKALFFLFLFSKKCEKKR